MLLTSLHILRRCSLALALILAAPVACNALTGAPFQIRTSLKNPIVWQGIGNWLIMTEDKTNGRVCYFYDPVIKISSILMEGMSLQLAPLGSEIKWLMYTDYYQNLDRLMAGDVDNDNFHIAWPSNLKQVGCGMKYTNCVFGQYRQQKVGDRYPVDLFSFDVARGGATLIVGSDSEKSQFAHDGDTIVYQANNGFGETAIRAIRFDNPAEQTVFVGPAFEPSVCYNLVAWAQSNGPGFDIIAKNLDTGEIRTVAYTTANPPRPEAGRGAIFWQDARNAASTGVDIYGYDWATAQEYCVTNAAGDQLRLRVCDDLVTWTTGTSTQTLWGARIPTPTIVSDLIVTRVTPNSVSLAWTSIGDTNNPGALYDLRYRTDGPITEATWATSATVAGLPIPQAGGRRESFAVDSLCSGRVYFALKVKFRNNTWSPLSNCVSAYVADEASALRNAGEGDSISFTGVASGIGAEGALYCQRSDRSQAVRVIPMSAASPALGQRLTVTGRLAQDPEFMGPVLEGAVVALNEGTQEIRPLGMRLDSLGGFDARWGGVAVGGPSNLWARVRIWGRVTGLATTGGCSFFLNDGCDLPDNNVRGALVSSPFPAPDGLADGRYVLVEGICRFSRADGRQIEVVEQSGIVLR